MRNARIAVFAALAVLGLVAAVAFAATNSYTVKGSVSPSKAGTPTKPKPASVGFAVNVTEASGLRPAAISTVELTVPDGVLNQKPFPKCSASTVASNASSCPAGSVVGSGSAKAVAGGTADPADKSLPCSLSGKIYNGANSQVLLHVTGSPPTCALEIDKVIVGKIRKVGKVYKVKFTIPDDLIHPAPGFTSGIESLTGTITKVTKKVKGKTVGLIATTACPGGKHRVTAKVVTEDGATQTVTTNVACTK